VSRLIHSVVIVAALNFGLLLLTVFVRS